MVLLTESLYDPDPTDGIVNRPDHLGHPSLHLPARRVHHPAHSESQDEHQRHQRHNDGRQQQREMDHDDDGQQELQHVGKHQRQLREQRSNED